MKNSTTPARPAVLYKYLAPERINIIENLELRFTPPTEFNDTFDADFLVPFSKGLTAITARPRLRNSLGIVCFTERPDDHLMWVHYARNHTGFVLGFDANAGFFDAENRRLEKVSYIDRPRVFAAPDEGVCFYKSKEWQYEREWRCVRKFDRSESRLMPIDSSLITEVIFGFKMEEWQIARIMQYATAQDMLRSTRFFGSTPARKSWSFENKPKKMSLCNRCSGSGYVMEDVASTSKH